MPTALQSFPVQVPAQIFPDQGIIFAGDPAFTTNRALLPSMRSGFTSELYPTFSGTDIHVQVTLPGEQPITLGELTTLSYSIHRENTPVRAIGHVAPVGFCKGPRTIAGTMIWTSFNHYGWYRIERLKRHITRSNYPLSDMLPPMDITVTFANEFGKISGMQILGVTLTDEGGTMSIDDLVVEQTMSYMARNLVPMTIIRG